MNFAKAEDVELILKTNKQSDSGIFSNERLLMIKAGIVSYFSEVPKKFSGTIKFIESSGQYPKYTIKASDIDSMELKANVLSLLFKKNKLIGREEFYNLVRSKEPVPEAASSHSQKDGNGYVKWNFQTENMEMMEEFFRLTNLFRSSNPKFKPSLSAVIDGYRGQSQKPKSRQMSMLPSQSNKMYNSDLNKKRMSEVPNNLQDKDLFLESLGLVEKKKEAPDVRDSAPLMVPQPFDQKTAEAESLKRTSVKENDRLSKLITRISVMNKPSMGTIFEKDSQDKLSEMSRNPRESLVQKKFEIKSSTSQIVFYPVTQPVQSVKADQEPLLVVSQSQIEVVEINLDKPSTMQEIILPSQSEITKIQEKSDLIQSSNPKVAQKPEEIVISHRKRKDRSFIELNASAIASETESKLAEEDSKRRKVQKLRNFFKATSYIDHFDPIQICKKMSISLQDLEQLMKSHQKQQQSAWNYIESNLSYRLAKQKLFPSNNEKLQQLHMNTELISQYHMIPYGQPETSLEQVDKKHMDPDISYISAQEINEEDQQAMKWMEKQMENTNPQLFTSKVLKNSNFKFYARQIDFKPQSIVALSGCWILNRGGYLEQFLGYLRLQRVLKEISSKISEQMQLICADTIYLRYKHYEAIAKQWRIGYPSFPIKSIKALEYISRSRQLKLFERDFPQFNIIAEVIREGYHYRLHIQRIEGAFTADEQALQNQFGKIVFTHDNQLDFFYHSSAYGRIEGYCLKQIDSILKRKKRIEDDDVYGLLESLEDNITVDTLCKLLCCRIDKKGGLFFNHTLLRLGGRQFGQQLSLIKRYKKRGNNELGRQLSKKLMGRLQIYQQVTPISHFIQIYLQIIDFMIVNEKQLHRAVPILLKVLHNLSDYQSEQYSVYLALMKTYLKLNQIDNFVKILENCRLFISQMFRQCSMLVDYPLQRIVLMLLLRQDTQRALGYSNRLIQQLKGNEYFESQSKQKYLSKLHWDRNNILVSLGRYYEAYASCESVLEQIESIDSYYPDFWIEGVLCLSKCWLAIGEVNSVNSITLQKKIARAIELSFSRENIEMVFVVYQLGLKVISKCEDFNIPCNLQYQQPFEQAKIQFNQTQAEIFCLLTQNQGQSL